MNMLKGYTAKNNPACRIFYTVKYINCPCQYAAIKRHWLVFLEADTSKFSQGLHFANTA